MRSVVEHQSTPVAKKKPVESGKVTVAANTLLSPFQLIQADKLKKWSDANEKKKKLEAKEAEQKEKEAKRIAMMCTAESCFTWTRKEGGAKGWGKCWVCSWLYCKKHKAEYELCVLKCGEGQEDGKPIATAKI